MDRPNHTSENIVGIYRDISTPERIINTSVGRTEVVQDFLEMLIRRVNSSHHTLFIGPRGIGKTHLLTLIVQGIQNSSELSERYTVIRFPEENNRILSFADFLLGVIEILASVIDDSEWRKLYTTLHTEENDKIIIDTILPKISAWHKKTKKNLLIMIENLNVLLTQQIKNKQSIHYLRSFLMDDPAAVFIGTAPVFFAELNDINHPLYDFFEIQIISELDENQTLELIKKNLEYDHCTEQLDNFESLVPKIKALHIMTGGNPRLIMLLYGLIAHERITGVKLQFQKLLDSISPFYQDRLKDLPPQEKALLENMALMRSRQEPRTPGNIAKKMRKPAKQISSLLKRMLKTGYLLLETDVRDRRRKIYRIKEGFFDLWLAMSLSRVHRNRFPYLAEFFANWYVSQQERECKREELRQLLQQNNKPDQRIIRQDTNEILAYLSDVGDISERIQTKIEIAYSNLKSGQTGDASKFITEIEPLVKGDFVFTWMTDRLAAGADIQKRTDVLSLIESMIEYWRKYRSGDLETAAEIAEKLSYDFSGSGMHKLNINFLDKSITELTDNKQILQLLIRKATSERISGSLTAAQQTLNQALILSDKTSDIQSRGILLNNISQIYKARGDYDRALDYLEQSLSIAQEIGDRTGEGVTLNNISLIYSARSDYDRALNYLERSKSIRLEIGDRAGEGTILNNISQIYSARGDYDRALNYLEQSLSISQEIGNRALEGTTLNNISQIYKARGDYDRALNYLEQSLSISQEIGNRVVEGTTLNNISQIYKVRGDYDRALNYLEQSLSIRLEIGDRAGEGTTLNNISQIYKARGDYDQALGYLEQSLSISQEIGNRAVEGTTLNNISQIYKVRGDYDRALGYLEQSLSIRLEIGNRAGEGTTLNNISQIYKARGDYNRALNYLEQSLSISQEIGNRAVEGTTLNNISQIYKVRGDYDRALEYLEQSLALVQEIGDRTGEGVTLFNMGHIFMARKKIKQALVYWYSAYQIARQINFNEILQRLEQLANDLGENGLKFWEQFGNNKYQ